MGKNVVVGVGGTVSSGGGAPLIGNVTLGSPVVEAGVYETRVSIPYTPPSPIGEFDRVWLLLQISGYNSTPGESGAVMLVGEAATPLGEAVEPVSKGVRYYDPNDLLLTITHETPKVATTWRIIAVSGSQLRMNDIDGSPSVVVTVEPPVVHRTGEEYAPIAESFTLDGIDYREAAGGDWEWRFRLSWSNRIGDPRQELLAGYAIIIEDRTGRRTPHAYPDKRQLRHEGDWWGVPAHPAPYIVYLVSFDTNGRENEIVPGTTPSVSFVVSAPSGGPGAEYTQNVSNFGVAIEYGLSIDGVEQWRARPQFTPPNDPKWGGVYLVFRPPSGGDVEFGPARGDGWRTDWYPMGSAITYTVYAVSHNTNNQRNTIVPGVTPQASVAVSPQTSGSLKGTRLVVGSISSNKLDANYIDVGGGGGRPGQIRLFDSFGVQRGFFGVDAGNGVMWAEKVRIGGSSWSTAPFRCDGSNLEIDNAKITATASGVTLTIDPSAFLAESIKIQSSTDIARLAAGYMVVTHTVSGSGAALDPGAISCNGPFHNFFAGKTLLGDVKIILEDGSTEVFRVQKVGGVSRVFVGGYHVLGERDAAIGAAQDNHSVSSFTEVQNALNALGQKINAIRLTLGTGGHGLTWD